MKKIVTVILFVVLALGLSTVALADNFNPGGVQIIRENDCITVDISDANNSVFEDRQPTLTIPASADFDGALLLFEGKASELEYDADKGGVSFTVAKGGTYLIVKGLEPTSSTAPSCTAEGSAVYNFRGAEYTETLPKAEHDFSDTSKETCANCAEPNPDYVAPSAPSAPIAPPSAPSTETEKVENPDGSVTTTVTDKLTGTVTETTVAPDGVSATVVTDSKGSVSKISAEIPADIGSGETVTVPVELSAADEPSVSVDLRGSEKVSVEFPVSDLTPGTVAVIVNSDGSETVVQKTALTENGIALELSGDAVIKIIDNSSDFTDVPEDSWFEAAVDFASARGIINGIGSNQFAPDDSTTRAMVWTMLARFEGVDTSAGDHWYEVGQDWAVESGVSDGTMAGSTISREQLVTMLWRYMGEPESDFSLDGYIDAGHVSSWAENAMRWAVESGIVQGMGKATLSPGSSATRAQVAQILLNLFSR